MPRFCFVFIILALSTLYAAVPPTAEAQVRNNTGETYRVETTDGSIYIGELVSESSEAIVLRTESTGDITIRRANIRRMTLVGAGSVRNGEYWYTNPNPTRYLFAPNAIGLEKGRGYYQNTWVFFNNVNYGISNNFSLGLGTVPLFFFGGSTPVWITPKVSFPVVNDRFHLSAGALLGGVIGSDGGSGGILYGAGTYGTTDSNITLSLGYGYSDGSISSSPVVNLSAMHRFSRRSYIITENYFFPGSGEDGLISAAYRYAAESASVDLGLIRPLGYFGPVIGIPWLGITLPFGN